MKKGTFNLLEIRGRLNYSTEPKSIKQTSQEIIGFLVKLSVRDPIFSSFIPIKRMKETIDINEIGKDGAIKALINYFLETTNWLHNTPTWDITENPTEDSTLSTGFQFSLLFKEQDEDRFYLTGNISCPTKNFPRNLSVANFNTNTEHTYQFSWYEELLDDYVEYWKPSEVSVISQSSNWTSMKVQTGIGRISYFHNDFDKFKIPKDLEGIDYQTKNNGTYLYVCPEFVPEKEAFFACEEKTENVMKELISRVPEYSK